MAGVQIPVVAVTKDEHHRPKEIIGDNISARDYETEILLANAEAHRFAIAFHRRRLGRGLLSRQEKKYPI
ncbi:MAG: excinuclease subunit [Patescibacteria group bacterium]|nr:excinuclease subunit [Patescibacteria group bacterium]